MKSPKKPRPQLPRSAKRLSALTLILLSAAFLLLPASASEQSMKAPFPTPESAAAVERPTWLPEGWLILTEQDLQEIVDEATARAVKVAVAEERSRAAAAEVARDKFERAYKEEARKSDVASMGLVLWRSAAIAGWAAAAILGGVAAVQSTF
jgi:hypothetical protein